MKKPLILFSLLILLVVSFVAGARFNQHGTNQNIIDSGERKILHYVDPMNPANTTKEPGIAPCGMPMEPVYADEDGPVVQDSLFLLHSERLKSICKSSN